jgi:hypothetical protein
LTAVWTAYPAEPLLSFFYSPVERASRGPRRRLDLDRRIHRSPIAFGALTGIEVPHS